MAEEAAAGGVSAVRGHAISFRADPFFDDGALVNIGDALVLSRNGVIAAFGPYQQVKGAVPADVEIVHYHDALICPGFVDTHVHYPQTGIIGAYGDQLIDWLNAYAFAEEQRFADPGYAREIARTFSTSCWPTAPPRP